MFGWIRKMASRFANTGLTANSGWLYDALSSGSTSDSGVSVTAKSAISLPPVWYAITKISGHVIQMPLTPHSELRAEAKKTERTPLIDY